MWNPRAMTIVANYLSIVTSVRRRRFEPYRQLMQVGPLSLRSTSSCSVLAAALLFTCWISAGCSEQSAESSRTQSSVTAGYAFDASFPSPDGPRVAEVWVRRQGALGADLIKIVTRPRGGGAEHLVYSGKQSPRPEDQEVRWKDNDTFEAFVYDQSWGWRRFSANPE